MTNNLCAVEFRIVNDGTVQSNTKTLEFINTLSASYVRTPISYLFFLNNQGRYISDVFLVEHDGKILLISKKNILDNLISHLKKMDLRKRMQFIESNLYVYQSFHVPGYADPRGLGNIVISNEFLPINETQEYLSKRIEKEIAEFDDFEHERSIIPEYASIGQFIAYDKGCYLGQELMQRVRTQGMIRKTVRSFDAQTAPDAIKILASDGKKYLALVRRM